MKYAISVFEIVIILYIFFVNGVKSSLNSITEASISSRSTRSHHVSSRYNNVSTWSSSISKTSQPYIASKKILFTSSQKSSPSLPPFTISTRSTTRTISSSATSPRLFKVSNQTPLANQTLSASGRSYFTSSRPKLSSLSTRSTNTAPTKTISLAVSPRILKVSTEIPSANRTLSPSGRSHSTSIRPNVSSSSTRSINTSPRPLNTLSWYWSNTQSTKTSSWTLPFGNRTSSLSSWFTTARPRPSTVPTRSTTISTTSLLLPNAWSSRFRVSSTSIHSTKTPNWTVPLINRTSPVSRWSNFHTTRLSSVSTRPTVTSRFTATRSFQSPFQSTTVSPVSRLLTLTHSTPFSKKKKLSPKDCFYGGRKYPLGESEIPEQCSRVICSDQGWLGLYRCTEGKSVRIHKGCTPGNKLDINLVFPECCKRIYNCLYENGTKYTIRDF